VEELRQRSVSVESYVLDARAKEAEIAAVLAKLDGGQFDAVCYSVAVRARSGKGSVALPPIGKRLAEELLSRKRPLLVISFGNPYLPLAIPQAPSFLLAYSPFPVSQRAAAKALLGEIGINGKLPVTLPGLFPRGHGLQVEKRITAMPEKKN
ncbi:MAG: hypothetical protein U0X75_15000, partial [Acidobacteriota bacterium]